VRDSARVSPDNWTIDQRLLDRPGNDEVQLDLFYDYRTNVPLYPQFQAYFREHQPPTLIVWGRDDHIFPWQGAVPYRRDLRPSSTTCSTRALRARGARGRDRALHPRLPAEARRDGRPHRIGDRRRLESALSARRKPPPPGAIPAHPLRSSDGRTR
jgi:hypothetical protein